MMTTPNLELPAAAQVPIPPAVFTAAAAAIPPLPELMRRLTPDEETQYAFCKEQLRESLDAAISFSLAFGAVRDKKLYRAEYNTFEDFCEIELKMKVRRAYRLFAHFETLKALNDTPTPGQDGEFVSTQFTIQATESQTRPFMGLPLEFRRDAWLEAVGTAPGGKMTAKHGLSVVRKWQGRMGLPVTPEPGQRIQSQSPAPARGGEVVELPIGNKQDQVSQAADQVITELRRLSDLIGTADSSQAAGVGIALELMQRLKDHFENVEQMQSKRR